MRGISEIGWIGKTKITIRNLTIRTSFNFKRRFNKELALKLPGAERRESKSQRKIN